MLQPQKQKWPEKKQPPFFWQTEFLQIVVIVLVVIVSAGALVRLAIALARVNEIV